MPVAHDVEEIRVDGHYSGLSDPETSIARARIADPCIAVIFGASGDLAKRKLLPAFYYLAKSRLLPDNFCIVGFARTALSQEQFKDIIRDSICHQHETDTDVESRICDWILKRAHYIAGDYHERSPYDALQRTLSELDTKRNIGGNCLFYFSTPPDLFLLLAKQLHAHGLTAEARGWRRVIIEKPFGHDLESAKELNRELLKILKEDQIYRIDHYLGKETVQNILIFIGVEHRGSFYDKVGALRDMVPSHLMQLMSLTAMEPPGSFQADAVRDEQTKVLRAVQPFSPEEVLSCTVRGQYDEGIIGGQRVRAYRDEPFVDPNSNTETFVTLKFFVDNWRWSEVPFYLRTGKRLPRRLTEIVMQFRKAPLVLFRDTSVQSLMPNTITIRIQPDEAISLQFGVKVPGFQVRVAPVNMDFRYGDYFKAESSTGYERLLYDCMIGDATLFQRADTVEAGWAVVEPVLDVWEALPARNFPNYAAGTWGPSSSFELMKRDGRLWKQR
jgi:glucose-6-phosphate 1-dehydrogenase